MGETIAAQPTLEAPPVEMRTGAFAMIDALGFKGIWRRHSARDVIQKLRGLEARALEQIARDRARHEIFHEVGGVLFRTDTSLLSDTIVVSASWSGTPRLGNPPIAQSGAELLARADWLTVHLVVEAITAMVVLAAADAPVPLAYRGCVSWGDFIHDDRFIVDHAAQGHEQAEAAIVWLHDSAKRVIDNPVATGLSGNPAASRDHFLTPYLVPLKKGTVDTYVVNPFLEDMKRDDRARVIARTLKTFDDPNLTPEEKGRVEAKRRNTEAFLTMHHDRWDAAVASMPRLVRYDDSESVTSSEVV
jgi:hypothetical protein